MLVQTERNQACLNCWTDGAASTESSLLELCRVVTEVDDHQWQWKFTFWLPSESNIADGQISIGDLADEFNSNAMRKNACILFSFSICKGTKKIWHTQIFKQLFFNKLYLFLSSKIQGLPSSTNRPISVDCFTDRAPVFDCTVKKSPLHRKKFPSAVEKREVWNVPDSISGTNQEQIRNKSRTHLSGWFSVSFYYLNIPVPDVPDKIQKIGY